MSRGDLACKVYVGDLSSSVDEKELEREFNYYGRLKSIWVARNPPGFAFIEYEDPRDADDAIAALDGQTICGSKIRVEPSSGKRKPKPWDRDGGRGRGPSRYDSRRPGRPFNPNDECYKCGERGHYAYDCRGYRSRRRSRSRERYRERSRSRSRSRGRRSRERSYTPERRRSPSRSPARD